METKTNPPEEKIVVAQKCQHWRNIHRKVCRRLWSEIDQWLRDIIANDTAHTTSQYRWFETKVNADTERLFQDPEYYFNQPDTFKHAA